jgi:hypothetical protein
MLACKLGMTDPSIACNDQHDAGDDPPPRGESEQVEQQIGEPRAGHTSGVAERGAASRIRPAGIAFRIGREDQREPRERRDDEQPPRLADETRDARRHGAGITRRRHRPPAC